MRVLLVDDEKDITDMLKRGLQDRGFNIDAYSKPIEALQQDVRLYDIAILDIRMPEMSGFELARALWRRTNQKLQVCFLSAFEINQKEAKEILPSLKSHCFLTKPVVPSELAKHIHKHFAKSSMWYDVNHI
jgi:DNA-binding response OmpR family regulator